jgi:pyrroloquinoline quinone biosynthesis protein D
MASMTEPFDHTVLSLAPDASVQDMGDGAVILLAGSGQLYTCNETTEAFLKRVDGRRDLGSIIALLCDEFDVDKETAAADFRLLAENLVAEGILGTA